MKKKALWACLVVIALVAAACDGGGGETTTTAAEAELGSPERPVQVLFVPSVESDALVTGGEVMDAALEEATGLSFTVSIPTSYPATIEEMCAAPADTMGFIPAFGYVLGNGLCGVDVALKAVRNGYGVYWAQIIVPRDSDIQSIADLEGLTWAIPDLGSTSGYLVPLVMFNEAGITTGEVVETGGHPNAVLAVYRGDADFGTSFYSPPLIEGGEWSPGDAPDVPDELVESCAASPDGDLLCGPNQEYRVLDARAQTTTDAPDIIQQVRILTISPEIPNDTLSFGPDFPPELRQQIVDALTAFAAECESSDDQECGWNQSIGSPDHYEWSGVDPATDDEYDTVRSLVDEADISLETLE
ncbi:MAG: phosphate/phosphite/phosphonate ABC transporter substrate-binding protein [Acidimicrobiia bacterium]